MVRKGFTAEQIINKLREAEIQINQAISIAEASRPTIAGARSTIRYVLIAL